MSKYLCTLTKYLSLTVICFENVATGNLRVAILASWICAGCGNILSMGCCNYHLLPVRPPVGAGSRDRYHICGGG